MRSDLGVDGFLLAILWRRGKSRRRMAGLRLSSESGTYHVISRGNNRSDVFLSPADKYVFLKVLQETKGQLPFALHHYVLMDNHVHMIMRTGGPELLSKAMKAINERHAMRFRRRHGGSGHVWQGRFKSFPVHDDAYLLTCGAYIELNPVRAGMVAAPEDYRWSSYHHY